MSLVVFDTNVIVSAGLKPGSGPAQLVDMLLARHYPIATCRAVISEYIVVTGRQKFTRYAFPPDWLDQLIEQSLQLRDPPLWPAALPDPKDAVFLSLAKTSGAWLITGNLKHFPEKARHGVTVISPGDYLARLGT
jgi:putative PIN family toxin of toxin-antitoxin system